MRKMLLWLLYVCAPISTRARASGNWFDFSTALNIDPQETTAAGLSSGAFFAVQLHVAYSSIIHGVGVFAGGPYYCASGSVYVAERDCMNAIVPPNGEWLALWTTADEALGLIDSTTYLRDDNVYLYSGSKDSVVDPLVTQACEDYYKCFVTSGTIATEYEIESEHCVPTYLSGNDCDYLGSPYINKCDYDGAFHAFQTLFGITTSPTPSYNEQNLFLFDQTKFIEYTNSSLEAYGYIYIPTDCQQRGKCKLNFNFHGCEQGVSTLGDTYMTQSGFNQWAEVNNIIVVYPSVGPSAVLGNPNGCWDWWGYTGANYVYQSAKQIAFVKNIYDALLA